MEKITFYDLKRSEVMVWTNIGFHSPAFLFDLSLTHSIYKVRLPIVVNMSWVRLLRDTLVILTDLKKQPECHKIALAENFGIVFASDGYGRINVALTLNDRLNTDLIINYQIDQSFLPEMIEGIELLLQDAKTLFSEKNQDSFVICDSSSLRLQNVIVFHEDAPNESYLRIKLSILQCYVDVELDMLMYIDEFQLFKEQLSLFRDHEIQQVKLAPLGEFVSIELNRSGGRLWMKGDISDLLMPQSHLTFQNEFDNLALQRLFEDVSLVPL